MEKNCIVSHLFDIFTINKAHRIVTSKNDDQTPLNYLLEHSLVQLSQKCASLQNLCGHTVEILMDMGDHLLIEIKCYACSVCIQRDYSAKTATLPGHVPLMRRPNWATHQAMKLPATVLWQQFLRGRWDSQRMYSTFYCFNGFHIAWLCFCHFVCEF